jgi:hypothetical protein
MVSLHQALPLQLFFRLFELIGCLNLLSPFDEFLDTFGKRVLRAPSDSVPGLCGVGEAVADVAGAVLVGDLW